MKVSSPVGDFPFTITNIRLRDRRLTVNGQMGRWPASIALDHHDLLPLRRYAPIAVAAAALGTRLAASNRARRPTHQRTNRAALRQQRRKRTLSRLTRRR